MTHEVENPFQHHRIAYKNFDHQKTIIQTLSFLITYEKNFLIDYQYMLGFYKDSRHKDE